VPMAIEVVYYKDSIILRSQERAEHLCKKCRELGEGVAERAVDTNYFERTPGLAYVAGVKVRLKLGGTGCYFELADLPLCLFGPLPVPHRGVRGCC
jgi:hypothetical protein